MKALISKPVNDTQQRFNELCVKGGGPSGGPARTKVLELLRESGQALNVFAFKETAAHFDTLSDANPWHVCYAIALAWGTPGQVRDRLHKPASRFKICPSLMVGRAVEPD